MPQSATSVPVPGTLDGRFRLAEELGRGSMGRVFAAFDSRMRRQVAVKISSEREPDSGEHPLEREFRVGSRMWHPNLAPALEWGRTAEGPFATGTPYLVSERAYGSCGRRLVHQRLSSRSLEAIAGQLLQALAFVHACGFVHRDLKPANLLVHGARGPRPTVRLVDYGLAVPIGTRRRLGHVSGCLPYLPPEALLGRTQDGRFDLYGLGILLYELATGKLPIPERDPETLVRWHLDGPALRIERHRPESSPRLRRLIRRLTARDPDRRPASAIEALGVLCGVPRAASVH